ncbi:MAG: vitamin K epoxide reductase family protein [Siphonobacter sp.]
MSHALNLERIVAQLPLKVTSQKQTLQEHPDYPSMNTLSEVFTQWHVENLPVRIRPEQLSEITYPAIAQLQQQNDSYFIVLNNVQNNQVFFYDSDAGNTVLPLEEFIKVWTGATLLFDITDHSGEPNYEANRKQERLGLFRRTASILFLGAWLLSGFALCTTYSTFFLNLLNVLGLVVSGFLVATQLGNGRAQSICQIGKKADCKRVLESPAATLWGWLSMSDVGLIWFSGFWFSLWIAHLTGYTNEMASLLAWMSLLAVGYVPFSIGYQWLQIKQWCVLCLLVQVILLGNAVLLFPYFIPLTFSTQVIFQFVFAFGITTIAWLQGKTFLTQIQSIPTLRRDINRFKYDTELFKTLWQSQEPIPFFEQPVEVRIGPKEAPYQLIMATNPYCNPCGYMHEQLETLQSQLPDDLSIVLRFTINPEKIKDPRNQVALHLLSVPDKLQSEALKNWFRKKEYSDWSQQYPVDILPETQEILNQHHIWCKWAGIKHTPTLFLNNRILPQHFNGQDLLYHLKQLIYFQKDLV